MECVVDLQGSDSDNESKPIRGRSRHHRKPPAPRMTMDMIMQRGADIRLTARHPDVYEPCDDSFALVDALLADQVHLQDHLPSLCVEVGSGSGYVITSLALITGLSGAAKFIATDLNPQAADVTRQTLAAHNVEADVIVTDLLKGLDKRLAGSVDLLLFNPPYVPTPDEEVGGPGVTAAWAGGERGRVVIDRMLAQVDSLLSSKGWFYMVTLTANNPGEICRKMNKMGFASKIMIQRRTEEESLHVLKFWRQPESDSGEGGGVVPTFTRALSARLAFWRHST